MAVNKLHVKYFRIRLLFAFVITLGSNLNETEARCVENSWKSGLEAGNPEEESLLMVLCRY